MKKTTKSKKTKPSKSKGRTDTKTKVSKKAARKLEDDRRNGKGTFFVT